MVMIKAKKGWFLDEDDISDLALGSLYKTILLAKEASHVDGMFRVNATDVWRQLDWIKYLKRMEVS